MIIRWGGEKGEQYFNFPPQSREEREEEEEGELEVVGEGSPLPLEGSKTHISSSSESPFSLLLLRWF